jgi:hypothetical protein
MGYFNAMREGLYRRTLDGQRVFARRSLLPWRKRWYYVSDKDKETLEKRIIRMHVALMVLVISLTGFLVDRFLSDPRWFVGWFLLIALFSAFQSRTTSDLEPASIDEESLEPQDRRVRDVAIARAAGQRTLWCLVAASVAMAAGQLYVIVTDGVWWAWVGLAMFTTAIVSTLRQLFLVRDASIWRTHPNTR